MESPTITDRELAAWSDELQKLEVTLGQLDQAVLRISASAEVGDAAARALRSELIDERASCAKRIDELRAAIESGRGHLERAANAKAQAARDAAEVEAAELAQRQAAAARKVDRAIAALETSWAEYRRLQIAIASARRRAGLRISNRLPAHALLRALFHGSPGIADELALNRAMRNHAGPLEHQP